MARITYVEFNGTEHAIEVAPDFSVMQGALNNNVPGIEAECRGGCACATCHVYVDPAWMSAVGGPSDMEEAMLEAANNVQSNSRLSCQIKVSADLDGLIVRLPASQY